MMAPPKWTTDVLPDPLQVSQSSRGAGGGENKHYSIEQTFVVHSRVGVDAILAEKVLQALHEGGRIARVALADYVARQLHHASADVLMGESILLELLDRRTNDGSGGSHRRRNRAASVHLPPFMLERSDIFCTEKSLHLYFRALVLDNSDSMEVDSADSSRSTEIRVAQAVPMILEKALNLSNDDFPPTLALLQHIAVAVLQYRLRRQLTDRGVTFVARGAILPRKSGASMAAMASPPAVPFAPPPESSMHATMRVDMGALAAHLPKDALALDHNEGTSTIVQLTGLLVPRGISLICGGGYHGKSTLLRCIAAGVYNKIPGDGREYCVTVDDALMVRAEDGRYVNNCNVSAFISNLPTPSGVSQTPDTAHFCTAEASGSTSQAANVIEALEFGASCLLVDEDVSAANFMARDGRMRALVMDESITPLLYRVNGLYARHGVSCIVVVGGVGDWLDVPDAVLLMDSYVCKDATKKARSVSKQFSHGHVQYGGRGVVHRLEWDNAGTPCPRRPSDAFSQQFVPECSTVSILEGGNAMSIMRADDDSVDDVTLDEGEHYIDLSRCEQLLGRKAQLYGCGLSVMWMLAAARQRPRAGIAALLSQLDECIDQHGLSALVQGFDNGNIDGAALAALVSWKTLVKSLGFVYRPRRFEIGQALTRLRGICFEELPPEHDDEVEQARMAEEERKKQQLLEMWNQRRVNKLNGVS